MLPRPMPAEFPRPVIGTGCGALTHRARPRLAVAPRASHLWAKYRPSANDPTIPSAVAAKGSVWSKL